MAKVSIIVPTYNVEKYIQKCLESLINQTLKDIEIICVDDKSTDGTLSLIKEFQQKDERIKLIENIENVGCSKSRNTGIDSATGEYIGFDDSDDWVDLDFYEKLYDKAVVTQAEVVKGDFVLVYPDKEVKSNVNKKILLNKYNFYCEFYTAIYKKEFLNENKIRFPEDVFTSEDMVFSVGVITKLEKLVCLEGANYFYLYRSNSKSKTLTPKQKDSILKGATRIISILNNSSVDNKNYQLIVGNVLLFKMMTRCCRVEKDKEKVKNFIDEINPKYSIISVGKNNRYGHPNDSVLNNLDDTRIYRTDQDGSVMFKIKNNKLQIETCSQ